VRGKETAMKFRIALFAFVLIVPGVPLLAEESATPDGVPMRALAPADEYFGRARLSVLGSANTIRDAGARLGEGAAPASMIDGPLAFAGDAIRDWEQGSALARKTVAWLVKDYPDSGPAEDARIALGDTTGDATRTPADAWSRSAALRTPLPPQH
jgi:hypothetical protein